MSLLDLFKPGPPQPVKVHRGLYECRRCGDHFEASAFNPCRVDRYKCIGGECYHPTRTHTCSTDGEGRILYGLGELIGATVTTIETGKLPAGV